MNNQKGMTLVELLAALTISTLVMAMIFGVFMMGMKSFNDQSSTRGMRTDADYVMTMISNTFYEQNGELTESDVSTNDSGRVILNGQPISKPNLDYNILFPETAEQSLDITLEVSPDSSGESVDPFILETTLSYPW